MNKGKFKLIASIVLVVVALILISLNLDSVQINLLVAKVTMPLVVFSLFQLGLGFVAGILFGMNMSRRKAER